MIFIVLTFIAAFAIEAIGTLVSVIGLSSMFGSNLIIIALAIALDVGKIVTVSFLYTYWKRIGWTMKTYALVASLITMTITSSGAFGYLSGEFTKATVGVQTSSVQVDILKKQQTGYELRKKQIDDQIASLPTKTTVNQRLRLMAGYKAEEADLDKKIAAIDDQLPKLQVAQVTTNSEAGPIIAISKIFNVSIETAVTYVICLIIPVFDPLAVFLFIVANFLIAHRKENMKGSAEDLLFSTPGIKGLPDLKVPELNITEDDLAPDVFPMPPAPAPYERPSNRQAFEELADEMGRHNMVSNPKELPHVPDDFYSSKTSPALPDVDLNSADEDLLAPVDVIHHDENEPPEVESEAASDVANEVATLVPETASDVPPEPSPPIAEVAKDPAPEAAPTIVEEQVQTPAPVVPPRELITLETLGIMPHAAAFDGVRPDPGTVVDASSTGDMPTPFKASVYPRPSRK